jgi:hypothetical protein
MQLYCIRLGRLIDAGQMTDTMAALAKYFCSSRPGTSAGLHATSSEATESRSSST